MPLQANVLTAIASAVAGVAVSGWRRRRRRLPAWALCQQQSSALGVTLASSQPTLMLQETLRTASVGETGTSNALGDKQLVADVAADTCVGCGARWVWGLG